jgi:hypothetical protein
MSFPLYQEEVKTENYPLSDLFNSLSFPAKMSSPTGFMSDGSLSDWSNSVDRSSSIVSIESNPVVDEPIVRRKSKGRKIYDCTYCGKVFNRSYCLNSHLVTHTGSSRFI